MFFVSSQNSPKLFCPKNRSFDIDAIYSVIDDAKQYVYIAVMDYLPISSTSTKRSVSVQSQLRSWAPGPDTKLETTRENTVDTEMLSGHIRLHTIHISVYICSSPMVHLLSQSTLRTQGLIPQNHLSSLHYKHERNFRIKIGLFSTWKLFGKINK